MYCSKCGKSIDNDVSFCRYCGNKVEINTEISDSPKINLLSQDKHLKKYIIIGSVVLVCIIYILALKCRNGLCVLPSVLHGEYCVIHTCNRTNCYNKVASGKEYCYTHSPTTSTSYNYKPEDGNDVLDFSDIEVSKNSSYTICNATITNNGKKTYTFVEVKGKFKDSSGKVLDTDWTYAVGSEGLAPGESVTFRLSVDKNSNITKCDLEILDYDKE